MVLVDGVDLERFDLDDDSLFWKRKLGLCVDNKYAIYSGHLYHDKGIEVILQSAKKLEKRKDLTFLLVGGFEKDKRFWKRYCDKLNISNVQFIGFIANSIVPQYLKAADCLLLPYKMCMYYKVMDINTTSPLKLFEYMASNRPIVASDIPTVSKVLVDKKNAILADPNNITDFSCKIQQVLDDVNLGKGLAAQARIDVKKYTWRDRCSVILEKIVDVN